MKVTTKVPLAEKVTLNPGYHVEADSQIWKGSIYFVDNLDDRIDEDGILNITNEPCRQLFALFLEDEANLMLSNQEKEELVKHLVMIVQDKIDEVRNSNTEH